MCLSLTGSDRPVPRRVAVVLFAAGSLLLLLVAGCSGTPPNDHSAGAVLHHAVPDGQAGQPVQATTALDLSAVSDLEGIIPELAKKRVVFVGERHDRYDHHLTQLEIIRRLHALHPRLAIGMEMFQQPFQTVLDDYVAGRLSEQELLRRSEYYRRWQFDFRLYAPILRYAREHRLPVVALNLPAELTRKVGREGFDGLTDDERAQVPAEIDRSDSDYEQRLREIFDQHPNSGRSFDKFLNVQLLWDEGMAQRAVEYLRNHPDYHMVVLAGSGHLARGSGIPKRLTRRLPVSSAIVLNDWDGRLGPELADFVLLTDQRALPPAGKLGALVDSADGAVVVSSCKADSPCERVGLKPGDRFVAIDGEAIGDMADLRLATWDKQPGDSVELRVQRTRWFRSPREISYTIELQ